MVRGRIGIAAASVAVVAGGLLAAIGITAAGASSTCTAPSGKCFLVAVSPQPVAGESQQQFTVTVTDDATTQSLGSVQISAPAGFVITGAPGGTVLTASTAQFLNLGISSGKSATLTVDATAPCTGAGPAWGVEAKQSNEFNGSGNDFVLDTGSTLSAALRGTCSLAFANQPNNAAPNATITSTASGNPPVSVDLLDGNGNVITSSTAPVTLSIGANPGSGTLSGTTTVPATAGVASFPGISINNVGWGYTLSASSPTITSQPATSNSFNIENEKTCPGGTCSVTTTIGTVTTSQTTSGQLLGTGVGGGVTLTCPSYTPSTAPLGFDLLSSSGVSSNSQFTVTLTAPKSPGRSLSSYQVCLATDYQFKTGPTTFAAGPVTIGSASGYYVGLLPTCPADDDNGPDGDGDADDSTGPMSCVLNRSFVGTNVVVTFLAYGDQFARM